MQRTPVSFKTRKLIDLFRLKTPIALALVKITRAKEEESSDVGKNVDGALYAP